MALADKDWTEISIHEVVLEFLRGEREKLMGPLSWLPVVDNPNLNDPLENYKRLRLLYIPRGKFMVEIPPDTTWWEVRSLTESELGELYVSARHTSEWDAAGNKLEQVASAIQIPPLDSPPDTWSGRIILWGHDKTGPFSIMEGNHRMLAYVRANPRPPLEINVCIGLSPSYCFWHFADPGYLLGNDLYK